MQTNIRKFGYKMHCVHLNKYVFNIYFIRVVAYEFYLTNVVLDLDQFYSISSPFLPTVKS